MPDLGIQIDQLGRVRVNDDGEVILSEQDASCCCGDQPDNRLYVRAADCCNARRFLWVLQDMVSACSVFRRTGGTGTPECWRVDRQQQALTAAQIRELFPPDPIDLPTDPNTPYPCGTCGVAPCPTCPDCCIAVNVPTNCNQPDRCCNMGRRFLMRYNITTHFVKHWTPTVFLCNNQIVAVPEMFQDEQYSYISSGVMRVERVRVGNECQPVTVQCLSGSVRTIRRILGPTAPPTINSSCVITVPPLGLIRDEDFTDQRCDGNPFSIGETLRDITGIANPFRAFNDYGPGVPNEVCEPDGNGGFYPLSGSWSGTNNAADWTSSATYTRAIQWGCSGGSRNESYHEVYAWRDLPSLVYTSDATHTATVTYEIEDSACGLEPCSPPGGGGFGLTLGRGGSGVGGVGVTGCSGCGGAGLVSDETIREMLRTV